MIYMFTLTSSGWHSRIYDSIDHASYDAQNHIDNGNTVAFGDCIGYFADQMKINFLDIKQME